MNSRCPKKIRGVSSEFGGTNSQLCFTLPCARFFLQFKKNFLIFDFTTCHLLERRNSSISELEKKIENGAKRMIKISKTVRAVQKGLN